ncbi:MAG TPA: 1-deoxy-D-xylulose-5-phosphate reductoisomerase [Alphaproteobacteria bacterium]|nr:1-deoxy-D-xylulose-5-phosphate reductoisomerase [Alphaproteobacteria bacterium]
MSNSHQRRVSILGATGSVGRSTLSLIEENPTKFTVEALTANRDAEALAATARRVGAKLAVVADESAYGTLRAALSGSGIEAAAGREAVAEAASRPVDLVMAAIVGAAGLKPTLAACRSGATVAFANKECLVCAGPLMLAELKRHGTRLLPVDSEHSAIFQVFDQARPGSVARIILTASGGPFRTWPRARMAAATAKQAVAHPIWSMGAKISVDSATMMNKGLEIIEARFLFDMPEPQIHVVVHPQSVIHSLVEYHDGSTLAQLGTPDMRTPIAVALAWPDRMPVARPQFDLAEIAQLTFEQADPERFPALVHARRALQMGGDAPTILNAANEAAVAGFLAGGIGFLDIERVVESALDALPGSVPASIDDVVAIDNEARRFAEDFIRVRLSRRSVSPAL